MTNFILLSNLFMKLDTIPKEFSQVANFQCLFSQVSTYPICIYPQSNLPNVHFYYVATSQVCFNRSARLPSLIAAALGPLTYPIHSIQPLGQPVVPQKP